MSFLFAGYFPKRVARRQAWLKAPRVVEIASVSECISKGPPNWIDAWRHNENWLFDAEEAARSVVPSDEASAYVVMAYRVWDRQFDDGVERPLTSALSDVPGPDGRFTRIGFDAVARSANDFGCSPLSCNGGAETFVTNAACLFETFDEATRGALEFSRGNWEPGPYWVVEVLRRLG